MIWVWKNKSLVLANFVYIPPRCARTKQVHFNKIRLLQPDFVLCNKEENSQEMVAELRRICPVWVSDVVFLEGNIQLIKDFGQFFDKEKEAL